MEDVSIEKCNSIIKEINKFITEIINYNICGHINISENGILSHNLNFNSNPSVYIKNGTLYKSNVNINELKEMEEELEEEKKDIVIYPEILLNIDYNNTSVEEPISKKTNKKQQQDGTKTTTKKTTIKKTTTKKTTTKEKTTKKIEMNDEGMVEKFLKYYMPEMLFIISTYKNYYNSLKNETVIVEITNIIKDYIILNLINFCKIQQNNKDGYKEISKCIHDNDLSSSTTEFLEQQFNSLAKQLNSDLFELLKKTQKTKTEEISNDIFKICISTENQGIANSRNKVFQTITMSKTITKKKFALCLDDSDFIGFFNYVDLIDSNFIKNLNECTKLSGEIDIEKGLSFRFGEYTRGQQYYGGILVSFWTKIFSISDLHKFKNNIADIGEDGPTLYSYLSDENETLNNVIQLKKLFNENHPRCGLPIYINYSKNNNPHCNAPIPIKIEYESNGDTCSMFTTFDYIYSYPSVQILEDAITRKNISEKNEIDLRNEEKKTEKENLKKRTEKNDKTNIIKNIMPPYNYNITTNDAERIFGYPLAKIISNHPLDKKVGINGYNADILDSLKKYYEFYTYLPKEQIEKMKIEKIDKDGKKEKMKIEKIDKAGKKEKIIDRDGFLKERNYLGTEIYTLNINNDLTSGIETDISDKIIHHVNKTFVLNYETKRYLKLEENGIKKIIKTYVNLNQEEIKKAKHEYVLLHKDILLKVVISYLLSEKIEIAEKILNCLNSDEELKKILKNLRERNLTEETLKNYLLTNENRTVLKIEKLTKYLEKEKLLKGIIGGYPLNNGEMKEVIEEYVKNYYTKLALKLLNDNGPFEEYIKERYIELNLNSKDLEKLIKEIQSYKLEYSKIKNTINDYFTAKKIKDGFSDEKLKEYKQLCSSIDSELLKKQELSVYYFGSDDRIKFDNIQFVQRLMWNDYREKKCGNIENYAFYGSSLMSTINNFFKKQWILCLLLICIMIIIVIIIIFTVKKWKIINKK